MSFVEKLRAIVGDKGLVLDKQGMHPYLTDWRENYLGMALAIVRPATTEEVSEVVKLCAAEKVAIKCACFCALPHPIDARLLPIFDRHRAV